MIEVSEFTSEMIERPELLKGDEFPEENLVVSFDFPAAARMIRLAEDEFDTMVLSFSYECF